MHSTGILVVPPYANLQTQTLNLSHREYDAKILFFITYFDRIASLPLNTPLVTMSTILEQTLAEQNIISIFMPQRVEQTGPFDVEFIADISSAIYEDLNQSSGEHWALAPPIEIADHFFFLEVSTRL